VNIFQPKQSLNTIFSLYIPKLVVPIVLYLYHFKWKEKLDWKNCLKNVCDLNKKKKNQKKEEEKKQGIGNN
jgi:amino acid permease